MTHFATQYELDTYAAAFEADVAVRNGEEIDVAHLKRVFGGAVPIGFTKTEEIDWLVEPFLAKGKLNIVHGDAGVGKSFTLLSVGALLSLGADPTAMLKRRAFNTGRKAASMLYYSIEADAATELAPRWKAMNGAPMGLYHIPFDYPCVSTRSGLAEIERTIANIKPALVVFDPILSFLKSVDTNSDTDVRAALDPLSEIAKRQNVSIVYVLHDNKQQGGKSQH